MSTRVIFRAYAVAFGLVGLALLIWNSTEGRMLGAVSVSAAGVAAGLGAMKDERVRNRGLLGFAAAHSAFWLLLFGASNWTWGQSLSDRAIAVVGGTAFSLFYLWLTIEGEFPQETFGAVGSSVAGEPLRSQYEQKIRQAAAQEERNRLARDLHDSIKQQIFAIQTAAATAQVRLDVNSSAAREALDQIRSAARDAMTEMEVMLDQLRAEPLESAGLVTALKKLCESTGFRTGARVEFQHAGSPLSALPIPGAAEAILRVAQEAMANIARHARPSNVRVSLNSDENFMELIISDDGVGFHPQQESQGMGTANMRSRSQEIGGHFDLVSSPESGTTVKFSVPTLRRRKPVNAEGARNRAISLGLMMMTIFFNADLHHWSIAPALAFVIVLAVTHYIKTIRTVRRLDQPVP